MSLSICNPWHDCMQYKCLQNVHIYERPLRSCVFFCCETHPCATDCVAAAAAAAPAIGNAAAADAQGNRTRCKKCRKKYTNNERFSDDENSKPMSFRSTLFTVEPTCNQWSPIID